MPENLKQNRMYNRFTLTYCKISFFLVGKNKNQKQQHNVYPLYYRLSNDNTQTIRTFIQDSLFWERELASEENTNGTLRYGILLEASVNQGAIQQT
jgi:hypothetical protein